MNGLIQVVIEERWERKGQVMTFALPAAVFRRLESFVKIHYQAESCSNWVKTHGLS